MNPSDFFSGAGVLLILAAFFLSTLNRMSTEGRTYFLLNMVGGALTGLGAWMVGSIPFVVMEVIWTIVAAVGLWKTFQVNNK